VAAVTLQWGGSAVSTTAVAGTVTGAESTSAQLTTAPPGISRASRPPSAYPSPALTSAPSRRTQAAVTIALRALLPPGAPVLVESPTYPGAVDAARAAGLRPVPVPVDEDGLRPDLLADAFAASGARAVYCQPTFHNPTGAVLSPARRADVLDVARAAGAFVVEDDFARHLAIEPPPPTLISADREGRVVHVSSLTKATAPSLRVAAVAARGPVAERIRATQLVDSFFVARPLQEAALELVGSPAWPRHLRTVGDALRRRRDTLVSALAAHGLRPALLPRGGLHVWAGLPDGTDDVALAEAASRAGVLVGAGRRYFPAEPAGPRVRLSYGSAALEAELVEGVARFARVLSVAR
jgi:DNA-binding transcriptional MocR family regulator